MTDEERKLREAVQMLAADNARLCDRLIAAEKIIDELRHKPKAPVDISDKVRKLIASYDAGKPS